MDGFFIVDKPAGVTSHDVVAFARRRLKLKKIGHAGTLDPLATGILILGVGAGTRLLEYLQKSSKEYEAQITFGATSDTYDAEGEVKQNLSAKAFTREDLEKVLPQFLGEISQVPPEYSAIKIDGLAAYDRVRAGEKVEMRPRQVRIDALEILKFDYPRLEIKIRCGSGTYIRSLAHDLGVALQTGAHLSKLKRLCVGKFGLADAIQMRSIRPQRMLPLAVGLTIPRINLTRVEADKIQHGQKIPSRTNENVVAGFFEDRFLAILEYEAAKRLLKPVKVFLGNELESGEPKTSPSEPAFFRQRIAT